MSIIKRGERRKLLVNSYIDYGRLSISLLTLILKVRGKNDLKGDSPIIRGATLTTGPEAALTPFSRGGAIVKFQ